MNKIILALAGLAIILAGVYLFASDEEDYLYYYPYNASYEHVSGYGELKSIEFPSTMGAYEQYLHPERGTCTFRNGSVMQTDHCVLMIKNSNMLQKDRITVDFPFHMGLKERYLHPEKARCYFSNGTRVADRDMCMRESAAWYKDWKNYTSSDI